MCVCVCACVGVHVLRVGWKKGEALVHGKPLAHAEALRIQGHSRC